MQKEKHFTPITIGIMGGSASGKTTFAKALAEALADFSPIVLNQDSYFRDWSEYSDAERERVITANHPDAVLWDALSQTSGSCVPETLSIFPPSAPVRHNAGTKKRACNRAML